MLLHAESRLSALRSCVKSHVVLEHEIPTDLSHFAFPRWRGRSTLPKCKSLYDHSDTLIYFLERDDVYTLDSPTSFSPSLSANFWSGSCLSLA